MQVRALPRPLTLPSVRITLTVLPWLGLAWFAWFLGGWAQGGDAAAYFAAEWPPDYASASILTPTYNYSPAFALLLQPFQALGWPAFHTLIVGLELAALGYLVGAPLALLLIVVQAPLVFREVLEGNLNLVTGALVVMAFRHPAWYAPMLLTKVTPGVGLVWFAVRREWRALGLALGVTVAIAGAVFVLSPASWGEWIDLLTRNERVLGTMPLLVRGPLAVGLIAWGAATNRAWTVPLGIALSFPANAFGWVVALGVIRLAGELGRHRGLDHRQDRRSMGSRGV